jgi:PAS domain S-box-containing protein
MADLPLPESTQLFARIRDLEDEVARLRARLDSGDGDGATHAHAHDARLVESEARFRVAFTTTPASLSIARAADGRFLYVNPTFCRYSGYEEHEILGRTFEELGIYADEAQRQRIFELIIATGQVENEPFRYLRRGGELRHGILSSRPIVIGGEVCQLGVLVNVTDTKRAEADRERLEERLRQAEKMEAIGRLAGGVAHDFNNMLAAILTNAELGLMVSRDSDTIRPMLEEIRDASRRAAQLTAQMLAYSRKQVLEPRHLSLSDQVSHLSSMLRRLIGEDITLAFALGEDLPPLYADPSQLEQVILNLVINARDAVRSNGRIDVSTSTVTLATHDEVARGRYSVLTVKDDGVGMSPELLSHVFEPFFSTKGARGTGLGLSTVDGIVTQHGGFVEVDSTPGQGTTFRAFWPEAPSDARPVRDTPTSGIQPMLGGTILVAEDDPKVREPTARLLQQLGFEVVVATSADDAVRRLGERSYDVLLSDMVMPDKSGREVARRARELHPHLPVVFMSGYPEDVIDDGGVLASDVVLLRKPFGAERLVDAIRRARAVAPVPAGSQARGA